MNRVRTCSRFAWAARSAVVGFRRSVADAIELAPIAIIFAVLLAAWGDLQ